MPDTIDPRTFGQLEAKVEALTDQLAEMRAEMRAQAEAIRAELKATKKGTDELREAFERVRGGWWTVGALFGGLIALAGLAIAALRTLGSGDR
jgi:hypothetical protein